MSLKPAELDEFGLVLQSAGLPLKDEELDRQIEQFPLVVVVTVDGDLQAFMFGSLERIGGTPSILWGLGTSRKGRNAAAALKLMTGELARRAAISFPDEDVLVATRLAHPAAYTLLASYASVVPRPAYNPSGEEWAWGRRLAKRFGIDAGLYDERTFVVKGDDTYPLAFDHQSLHPEKLDPGLASVFAGVDQGRGDSLIAFGWALADDLVKLV
jgi:hypothetical protein